VEEETEESLLALAEHASAGMPGPDGKASLGQLEQRHADLLVALRQLIDQGRTDEAVRLANALYRFWITKQEFVEGAAWFDQVLASPDGDERLRGRALLNAGFMPFWQGDDEGAKALFDRGLEVGRRLEDPGITAPALSALARVALRSDVAEARRLAREALSISDQAADLPARSDALHLLGVGAQMAGDLLEAREWMTQRLALVREQGNSLLISSEAGNLSMVERQLGNLDAAETLVTEALQIAERGGDDFMKPFALSGLAAIATERGAFERGAILIGAAEAMLESQGAAWPPDERPHYEQTLLKLSGAMDPDGFDRRRAQGHAMASSEAVALALGSQSAASPPP